jgi:hypothetical protein
VDATHEAAALWSDLNGRGARFPLLGGGAVVGVQHDGKGAGRKSWAATLIFSFFFFGGAGIRNHWPSLLLVDPDPSYSICHWSAAPWPTGGRSSALPSCSCRILQDAGNDDDAGAGPGARSHPLHTCAPAGHLLQHPAHPLRFVHAKPYGFISSPCGN